MHQDLSFILLYNAPMKNVFHYYTLMKIFYVLFPIEVLCEQNRS